MRRSNGAIPGTRTKSTPIGVPRTRRPQEYRCLTSLNAGKLVPLAAIPLLREDRLSSGNFRVSFEMSETVEVLMNAVQVRVTAYLVPKLAFERFDGLDDINRSYEGIAKGTNPVVPWFETMTVPTGAEILLALGRHARVGSSINTDYIEAYNAVWNHRATERSPNIVQRDRLEKTLAPAFWPNQTFAHIVPSFDQAIIDGEISMNVVNAIMPVKGIGVTNDTGVPGTISTYQTGSNGAVTEPGWHVKDFGSTPGTAGQAQVGIAANGVYPLIYAELQEAGVSVSLSNIELARKTQAFANLRRQYNGLSEDYLIDLLMDGISIPEQEWKKPLLLADRSTVFGMSKRYASDGANLTESVVNGGTFVDLRLATPRVPMSGVVMIFAEIAPEQLFERQQDPYLAATTVDVLPQYLRDELDPEKVSVVTNEYIDVNHSAPTGTFGYAPLNHQWAKSRPNVGGRFYRPQVDGTFDEDRQRIWSVETKDPVLSEDFYLVSEMNYKPFVVTDPAVDHFECLVRGSAVIDGLTVFGGYLIEGRDDYDKVLAEAPQDRIEQPPAAASSLPQE